MSRREFVVVTVIVGAELGGCLVAFVLVIFSRPGLEIVCLYQSSVY
jgi:hypothetical protein